MLALAWGAASLADADFLGLAGDAASLAGSGFLVFSSDGARFEGRTGLGAGAWALSASVAASVAARSAARDAGGASGEGLRVFDGVAAVVAAGVLFLDVDTGSKMHSI